ncbi:MAG: DUF2336 domain-containing protein [Alphaproteobacteria bacterium]|nr:DUF2336 domain-containing protein [Alphaproteobacteria bacterium]
MLGRLLGRQALPDRPSYEQARDVLEKHAVEMRRILADKTGVEPEILYYLAEDADTEVRRRVARNSATPALADKLLSTDSDEDVRAILARKVARLMPNLPQEQSVRVRELVVETLERLADDQVPRVRAIVAEEIKCCATVSNKMVLRLARDVESIVSTPILEYSTLLSDADLMEIVALARVSDSLTAVARRKNLSAAVCDAVIATLDIPATAALLANGSADITERAMEALLSRAAEIEAWHEPLVSRPNLSSRVVKRIAGFVSSALIERLIGRQGLDEDTASDLKRRVRQSIDANGLAVSPADSPEARVRDARARGALNDAFVAAAAENGERDVVVLSLATLADIPAQVAKRIVDSRSARAIASLTWRAGLSMRVAMSIQTGMLKLTAQETLLARGGTNYPMSPEEMAMHLELFGVSCA